MFQHTGLALRCLLAFLQFTLAYRPVQFVKHTGDNGRADQAFSITQHYNSTTSQSDLYVRMEGYRYRSSNKGWTALALGSGMEGALMFITYGDPNDGDLTLTVRTADGHHPPRPLPEMTDFYSGATPIVEVTYTHFDEYYGAYYSEALQMSPSHVAVAEFIVRGYTSWSAGKTQIDNTTTSQGFIWSSNFKQNFENDFTQERSIDMHQFGLGFGWVRVDLLNAETPTGMFGAINDQEGHKGVNEIAEPAPPTAAELDVGDAFLAAHDSADTPATTPTAAAPPPAQATTSATSAADDTLPTPTTTPDTVAAAAGLNIRSLLWHLHGLLMISAFLFLYPLGIFLLRSGRPTAFNLHWTTNALASIAVVLGAVVGWWNSHSISITHQYVGFAIVVVVAVQVGLGWWHHVRFVETRGKTVFGVVHGWVGRVLVPVAFVNIITGLQLREYSWFTILLVGVVMVVEVLGGGWYLWMVSKGNVRLDVGASGRQVKGGSVETGAEAEEYFALQGDDDGEFSDEEEEAQLKKKREEVERLRRLDKV